ncbi:MAG: SUMF1/EgtB/PvdO family nonheme iron enzyme [Magnetococcales bacterium]|nr:SUMF1/EgtB/PvdO family nonheme iron enzyme [Magnetococcales bacterium]
MTIGKTLTCTALALMFFWSDVAHSAAPRVANALGTRIWTGSGTKSFVVPINTFVDDDRDSLTFSASRADGSALPAWLRFTPDTRTLSGNPPAGLDTLAVRITARDGTGNLVHAPLTLAFNAPNDPPVVANPITAPIWSGSGRKSFQIPETTFTDGDGDALTLSATLADGSKLPPWLSFAPSTRTLSGNPPPGQSPITVKITANDGHHGRVSSPFSLSFDGTNDSPVVATPVASISWSGSGLKSFRMPINTFRDGDRGGLIYAATLEDGTPLPGWLRFSSSQRVLFGNPPTASGTLNVKITARDAANGTISTPFTVTWSNGNDAPTVVTPLANLFWAGADAKSFQVPATTFADRDRDGTLVYSATREDGTALPSWLRFSPETRTFSGTVPSGTGNLRVKVTVQDSQGGQVYSPFTLFYRSTNAAPVAVADSLITSEDTPISDTLTATDADHDPLTNYPLDPLTYAIVTNGTKGVVTLTNAATGAFTYTPNSQATGTDSFTFRVNDRTVDSNTATVTVRINPVNDAPVAESAALSIATGVASTTGRLIARDAEGDALTYRLVSNGRKGTARITNTTTGAFSYTPNFGASGFDSFTFEATDGRLVSNTARINVGIGCTGCISNSVGMFFRQIPAGTFTMGGEGHTPHQVTISRSFYMQVTEITQGQWRDVMGNNPSYFSSCGDTCPVEQVSWDDLQTFITRLNARGEGTYRLPTEAEWEYAARAGTTTAYSFGESESNLGNYGWYDGNSSNQTHPVAQKLPNPWGLYDMHGNVWEWVLDWYGSFESSAVTDPQGPSSGSYRVFRGGGWYFNPVSLRSAGRADYDPGLHYGHIGARLVRVP